MRPIGSRRLWLGHAGDLGDVCALHAEGIRAVVELADGEPPAPLPRDLIHMRIPLADGAGNPAWALRLAAESVAALLRARIPLLVGCSAGMSRSVVIAAAGIALAEHRTLAAALAEVTSAGPADVAPGLLAELTAALAEPKLTDDSRPG